MKYLHICATITTLKRLETMLIRLSEKSIPTDKLVTKKKQKWLTTASSSVRHYWREYEYVTV